MNIKYSKDALKFLAKVQKPIANNIREAIKGLTVTPPEGDIKVLQGYDDGIMRFCPQNAPFLTNMILTINGNRCIL